MFRIWAIISGGLEWFPEKPTAGRHVEGFKP